MTALLPNPALEQYLTIPGLGSSGAHHWQTLWEKAYPDHFTRVEQDNWDLPDCTQWVEKMQKQVIQLDAPVVLVAHSLGCIAVVHWASLYSSPWVKAAFLVAPADAEECKRLNFVKDFSPISTSQLSCRSMVVASTNDPYCTFDRAALFASDWGSTLVNVGNEGHINALSGHGSWPKGLEWLVSIGNYTT